MTYVEPDVKTYNTLMGIMDAADNLHAVLQEYKDMVQSNLQPDSISSQIVVSVCRRGGIWKEALNLLSYMQNNGYPKDLVAYNVILVACLEMGTWEDACKVLHLVMIDCICNL